MAAELLTQQQIQDAYNIYEKGFECGVQADDGLGFALASLDLSEKMHLKQVAEKCVKKDHGTLPFVSKSTRFTLTTLYGQAMEYQYVLLSV
mmetsp:Transcript_12909/g.31468  ORF Transcript_12909/g.31468 Transcript_12909/m.31468 type:complete len:91 (-) Transcript_12909:581-853(-)